MGRRVIDASDLLGVNTPLTLGIQKGRGGIATEIEVVVDAWETAPEYTEQTRARMTETARRFGARMQTLGIPSLRAVLPEHATSFVQATTLRERPPELTTQHARRTCVRLLYRTARHLGMTDSDPTLDLRLPPRGARAARPLTDDEITLCRVAAQTFRGRDPGMRAVAWALAEATAISSEITAIRVRDVETNDQSWRIKLPGTRRHDPRTVALTPWGQQIIAARMDQLRTSRHDEDALLAYGGAAPLGGAKAQASVCNALRQILDAAGLRERDIRPGSVRNWRGRQVHRDGASLPSVACLLGLRSLDAAAEDIDLRWHPDSSSTDGCDQLGDTG